jgi:hypothetical protein
MTLCHNNRNCFAVGIRPAGTHRGGAHALGGAAAGVIHGPQGGAADGAAGEQATHTQTAMLCHSHVALCALTYLTNFGYHAATMHTHTSGSSLIVETRVLLMSNRVPHAGCI